MTKNSSGTFEEISNNYFDSEIGSYTQMTLKEVEKGTFNVKAPIRKMLIDRCGESNIPERLSTNNTMRFIIDPLNSDFVMENELEEIELVCKFSKPLPKKEMTIYFSQKQGINPKYLVPGNYWYIYFKRNSSEPILGIMNSEEFNKINLNDNLIVPNQNDDKSILLEPLAEENDTDLLGLINYTIPVKDLTIELNEPPKFVGSETYSKSSKRKIIPKAQSKIKLLNDKIKGDRGEEIVLKYEKKRLIKSGRSEYADRIKWVSEDGDGHGYDIISFAENEIGQMKEIYIEVKSTQHAIDTDFFISENELTVSKEMGDSYYIYRVYEMNHTDKVSIFILQGSLSGNSNVVISPISYRVSLK